MDLGSKDRFKATAIHELGHASINSTNIDCGLDPEEDDVDSGEVDHSCGGITEDGEQTPMIIANVDNNHEIPPGDMCQYDSEPEKGPVRGALTGEFTTEITDCTKEGLEDYHKNN